MEKIDWKTLRDDFFRQCVEQRVVKENGYPVDHHIWVSMHPHNLFEWFKSNIEKQIN
jgi:hypothetical protein